MSTTTEVTREMTAEESARFERLIEQVEAEKPELIRRAKLAIAAGDEPGFSGDLRRAIHAAQIPLHEVAAEVKMDVRPLCDFLEGAADLTSSQIDALVKLLELQLVRTIPATPPAPRRKKPT